MQDDTSWTTSAEDNFFSPPVLFLDLIDPSAATFRSIPVDSRTEQILSRRGCTARFGSLAEDEIL
jgi:hypothetical protein